MKPNAVARAAGRIGREADRRAWLWLAVFVAVFLGSTLAIALRQGMWTDEFFTFYVSSQPSVRELIRAIREGVDNSPPLYFLILHSLRPLLGSSAAALRLPSMLGVGLMCVTVFAFGLRRYPALYAAVAMLFAANALQDFASEARAYGLVLGLTGAALYCWQSAAEGRRRKWNIPLMSFSLMAAISLHYFAVFLLIPLSLGELVRKYTARKLDVAMLAALIVTPVALLPHLTLIQAEKPFLQYFWSKAIIDNLIFFFNQDYFRVLEYLLPAIPILAIWPSKPTAADDRRGLAAHEWTAVASLAAMPVVVFLIAKYTTGTFVDRYVSWAVLGFSLVLTAVVYRISPRNDVVACSMVAILLGVLGAGTLHTLRARDYLIKTHGGAAFSALLESAPAGPEPILVADLHVFMALAHYGAPNLRPRVSFVVDRTLERKYAGYDTSSYLLSALRRRSSLRIYNYREFMAANPKFLLAAKQSDWLVWQLIRSGCRVTPIRENADFGVYRIEQPQAASTPAQSVSIRLEAGAFKVAGWEAAGAPADNWADIFAVYAGSGDIPPMLGAYSVEDGLLVFRPRFPLSPGVQYRAVFHAPGSAAIETVFDQPRSAAVSSTRVEHVYPSTDLLPSNQLKLYIYFSAPMSRGEAWRHIHLLDEHGSPVKLVFVEIQEELWDRDYQRLTVLFDPGRIKRGLVPNLEDGPPIEQGKRYTLTIDRDWKDARGAALTEGFRKPFRVGPADRTPPDPKNWLLSAPQAGTSGPLIVDFGEPMDYALLLRLVQVPGVPGNAVVGRDETEWRFVPDQPWKAGEHMLVVDRALEDLAGNRIGRAFDVDTLHQQTELTGGKTVSLPFQVR